MPSIRCRNSLFSLGTHHIFFPPRLEAVVTKNISNPVLANRCYHLSPHRFLGQQAQAPLGISRWRITAGQRHNPLTWLVANLPGTARANSLVERGFQSLLPIAGPDPVRRIPSNLQKMGNLIQSLAFFTGQ